jgi:hypothetical protein
MLKKATELEDHAQLTIGKLDQQNKILDLPEEQQVRSSNQKN